ncbi:MAG TPA: hypothetical protein VJN50_08085 [Actinomycetota bacterium]|nr:hypothetical protein [Actinomycetota bacterium]
MHRALRVATSIATVALALAAAPLPKALAACSWNVVQSPSKGTTLDNFPTDVSASSPSDAWIAGFYRDDYGDGHTLTLRWNGSKWKLVATADPDSQAFLQGVSALSNSDAWAVGNTISGSYDYNGLILHWNGGEWTVETPPADEPAGAVLYDVLALGRKNVWAVGLSQQGTLVEHWDGTEWSVVPGPNPGTYNSLTDVTRIPGTRKLWAVGSTDSEPLFAKWTGTMWNVTPGPDTTQGVMQGVTAIAADDVWAAGYDYDYGITPNRWITLIEHFDGLAWSIVSNPSPSTSFPGDFLYGIAAVLSDRVFAVGHSYDGTDFKDLPLFEAWDGADWTEQSTPAFNGSTDMLGVAAIPGTSKLWAAGFTRGATRFRTLVERFSCHA